jgi:hypothetical protein
MATINFLRPDLASRVYTDLRAAEWWQQKTPLEASGVGESRFPD